MLRVITLLFHNSEDEIVRLLNSLQKHLKTPAEVVLWNNGGANFDCVKNWSAQHTPSFAIVLGGDGRNLGFASGVNRAAELDTKTHGTSHSEFYGRANWDTLLCFNPDAELASDLTDEVLAQLTDLHSIVGFRVFNDRAKTKRQASARSFPNFFTSLSGREGLLTKFFPNNIFSKKYLQSDLASNQIQKVDWVSGCALFTTRDIWQKLKGFEESYFFAVEDVDLGRKAQQCKIAVQYAPMVDVIHEIGSSAKKRPIKSDFYHHMGMWIYFIRWSGPVGFLCSPLIFVGIWLRFLFRRWIH